jgi:hypothetical protein
VKEWSLKVPNKCVQSMHTHSSSVWSLLLDNNTLYSGDSKGKVFKHQNRLSESICALKDGIVDLFVKDDTLYVAQNNISSLYIHDKTDPLILQGDHGIIKSQILKDKRHVVTLNSADVVQVFDIIQASNRILDQSFDDAIESLNKELISAPTWCRIDIVTGV